MEFHQITQEKKDAIVNSRFPRAAKYDPEWQLLYEMGSPCLWLTEIVSDKLGLKPGMKVLDLGCGQALSSIFLAKEYGVHVFATDLWISPSDNLQRIREAKVEDLVFPIYSEAHSLPFAEGFFDAAICVNSYQFYGTADTYFNNYLGKLIKPGGKIGFAIPGLHKEFEDLVPEYLSEHWNNDFYYFHSLNWWKRHFGRCGTVNIDFADDFTGYGSKMAELWEAIPDRMQMVRTDVGRNISWFDIILTKK